MKPDKKHRLTLEALEALIHAAERVDSHYGHDDKGEPLDWSEWVDLRRALQNARHAADREGFKITVIYAQSVKTQGTKVEDYYR